MQQKQGSAGTSARCGLVQGFCPRISSKVHGWTNQSTIYLQPNQLLTPVIHYLAIRYHGGVWFCFHWSRLNPVSTPLDHFRRHHTPIATGTAHSPHPHEGLHRVPPGPDHRQGQTWPSGPMCDVGHPKFVVCEPPRIPEEHRGFDHAPPTGWISLLGRLHPRRPVRHPVLWKKG